MRLPKVKICGITNWEDAVAAACAGCDAVGFVFYKESPRYITPQKARRIARLIPPRIKKVGVFVNAGEHWIKNIACLCGLDMLQFHGDETPGFCRCFKGYKIIKAFRISNSLNSQCVLKYKTYAWLFDAFVKDKPGGTGRSFNWRLLQALPAHRPKIFISGGLNARNVRRAIKIAHPDWVDASSAVESKPGKKDSRKIKEFIQAAKKVVL